MHLALFVPSMRGGGAERVMAILANGLAERGYRVDLVLARAEGPYIAELSSSVNVVDLGARRVLTSLPALVGYLRSQRPQVMLSALNYANVIALIAKKLARVKTRIIVSERTTLSEHASAEFRGVGRLVPLLMRRLYPQANAIVAVSNGAADALADMTGVPRARIHSIPNPVVDDTLLEKAAEPLDHPWAVPGAKPFIVAVGRLTDAKDYPTLIRAFASVKRQADVRLAILGEGELRGDLEALVSELGLEEDVWMPGFVANPFQWMRACAVYVLSSKREGLPGALIQALACGARVVSTDCRSGPDEILEGGKWGKLVPVEDDALLGEVILSELDSGDRRVNLQVRVAEYRVEKALRRYEELLVGD